MLVGPLLKMRAHAGETVSYELPIGEQALPMAHVIGKMVSLEFTGVICCIYCGRQTKKSFGQGYCFPCVQKLARCDLCIVRPETCHFDQGTCREPDWAKDNCLRPHYVYLANASGVKVGITREGQIPTRFIDQGAQEALPIFKVKERKIAGLLEVALKEWVSDKTNWRAMLQGPSPAEDLAYRRDELFEQTEDFVEDLLSAHGAGSVVHLLDEQTLSFSYPILAYPKKVLGIDLLKTSTIKSRLLGIKGQYLLFEEAVMNVRKHAGHEVKLSFENE